MAIYEPKGVTFNKQQTEYQLFPEEYFTGTDCYIYFNDVWMDDLTGLSFTLNETGVPIYGYGSRIWDHFARGRRVVEGQFSIAFKEAGHLFTVFDHIGRMGNQKKTAISWLMNKEADGIPEGYHGVLERMESALQRINGDPSKFEPDQEVVEDVVVEWKWPVPMKLGMTDQDSGMDTGEDILGHKTSIRQMQQFLVKHGYGWKATSFKWGKYYNGDTWKKPNGSTTPVRLHDALFKTSYLKGQISKNTGDWYMCLRYWPTGNPEGKKAHSSIARYDAFSTFEADLQKRLDDYPGIKGFNMGGAHGRYDGRYGDSVVEGLRRFLELAEINDGSKGEWVSPKAKKALEMGFGVTGKYDLATKIAVWLFQEDMISKGRLSKSAPDGIVDVATMKAMEHTVQQTKIIPGDNKYRPDSLADSLSAAYEAEVWGHPFVDEANTVRTQETFFYRSRKDKDGVPHTLSLEQGGFDLYINYGPLPQFIQSKLNEVTTSIDDTVSFNTTVKAIRNVQITNVQQILDARTGQAIEEIYTFIARDLD